jgi:hypothetical protein
MKISPQMLIASTVVACAAAIAATPATASAHPASPCTDGQVRVTNGGEQAASGHRRALLRFSLAPGAHECTLTGYPGVDSGAGGPLIHAGRTMSGFMGGLRDSAPTVVVTADSPASAVVEGVAADAGDPQRTCPTYTQLLVTAPDTTNAVAVGVDMDVCDLQVHPVDGHAAADIHHDHSETTAYAIDISYPTDYPDLETVSNFVNADRGYFLDWIVRHGHDGPPRQYTYHVEGTTYRSAHPATTSLVLTIQHDTGAAHEAHPQTLYSAFTYDLATHRPITVDSLFRPDADLVSALGPRVTRMYDRPTNSLLQSDFRNFALTDDAVIFFFGEGQLSSADNTGPRQLSIPRSELAPLMA